MKANDNGMKYLVTLKCLSLLWLLLFSTYSAFTHDVKAAILVFQNNAPAAMLVYQEIPRGVELLSHVNAFFSSNKLE